MGNFTSSQEKQEIPISLHNFDKEPDYQSFLGKLRPQISDEVQTIAVRNLIVRLLGKNASLFDVLVNTHTNFDGKDHFKIKKNQDDKILIIGSSGVAVAWGLHYYLKTYCKCHISWEGSQLALPSILPDVNVVISSNDRFRYYQNVCTAGYSSAWWQWNQWEKNIDWMALNGFNLALAFHAQEAIWERVYLNLNLDQEEIAAHFGGPAFLPWARMGNIRGWGGPLSESWHNHTIKLQHLILNRMRGLGITPVLPAFAGHVPDDLLRVFPNANVKRVKQWNDFEDQYCCSYALAPTDPLFGTIGEQFLRMYIDEFGTNHVYNCDAFNENDPHSGSFAYLRATGRAIYSAMSNVDPDAIWMMQGWLFVHSSYFWNLNKVRAFVTSVPIGRMIILDLQSEQFPQYGKFNSYFGQPFIWCMLHNFGGTLGMFGSSGIINKRVFEARQLKNSTMIGTGIAPEGINQNYVIYDLMTEMFYRDEPANLYSWFADYATRRYGCTDEGILVAWQEMGRSIYNYSGILNIRGHYTITRRPSLNIKPWYWYDLHSFFMIWSNFVKANEATTRSDLFKHDLVDISRQALQITADFIYLRIKKSYETENITNLQLVSSQLLELFDDLEELLASSPDFLLGRWLEDAKSVAVTRRDKENFEFNARNQISLWGPKGEIVDYANKQWSGVVSDYFRPRWKLFLGGLEYSVRYHEPLNGPGIRSLIYNEVELPFSYSKKIYPTVPEGDSLQIATKIYNKWRQLWI